MPNTVDNLAISLECLGHNKEMPSRLRPLDMPERPAMALKALTGISRLATIRFLLDHPDSPRSEIIQATGMSAAGARIALMDLEEFGYVTASIAGPRSGRNVRYSANRATITDDLCALLAWTIR